MNSLFPNHNHTLHNNRPTPLKIGLFDSGIGGLSVLRLLADVDAFVVYLADGEYMPYGDKTFPFILQRMHKVVSFFETQEVDLIAIACHTACVGTLKELQKITSLPIFGISSSLLKEAEYLSKNSQILILGTKRTIESNFYFDHLSRHFDPNKILSQSCPHFATFAENLSRDTNEVKNHIHRCLGSFARRSFDAVLLACTHFPFLQKEIISNFAKTPRLIDPSLDFANSLRSLCHKTGDLKQTFFVTKNPDDFILKASYILQKPLEEVHFLSL